MRLSYLNVAHLRLSAMNLVVSLVLVAFVMTRLLCLLVRGRVVIVVLLLKRRLALL